MSGNEAAEQLQYARELLFKNHFCTKGLKPLDYALFRLISGLENTAFTQLGVFGT